MYIKDIMNKDVITASKDDTVREVALKLKNHGISGLPVVDEKRVVGIVSEEDIIKSLKEFEFSNQELWLPTPFEIIEIPVKGYLERKKYKEMLKDKSEIQVSEIMSNDVYTVSPSDKVAVAAKLITKHKVNRLPVVDEKGNLVGIVARGDIISSIVR